MSWLTPSSSPPTTPISTSRMALIAFMRGRICLAISRFSSSGTAEPSHMCDWKIGLRPALTSSSEAAMSGYTKSSSAFFGQWSVCSATVIGYDFATSWAKRANASAPVARALTVWPAK